MKKIFTRILALALVALMVCTMLPSAFAAEAEDFSFTLTLPEHIQHRNRFQRAGKGREGVSRVLSVIRHVSAGNVNDYEWNYRWYVTYDLNTPGVYYADTKDITLNYNATQNYYLYCKVAATKNGVTKTQTTNPCYVEIQGDNLFSYDFASSVEEITLGEPFDLSLTINIREMDGTIGEQYESTIYPQTFTFSCADPNVVFKPNEVETLGGSATVSVTVPESYAESTIDFNVHIIGDISKKWFNELPPFDVDCSYTMPIAGRNANIENESKLPISKYFDDVKLGWAVNAIDQMKDLGYMNGTSSTTFSPNAPMSRAMLVTTLYRMTGAAADTVYGEKQFSDVPADAYYAQAVRWASAKGIIKGVSNGKFAPNQSISRQDLAAILYRYIGSPYYTGNLTDFTDSASVSSYAISPLLWATSEGIITGSEGMLNPAGTATRAQVAVILNRFVNK